MAQGRYIENVCVNKKEIAQEGFMGNFIVQLNLKSSIAYCCGDRERTPAMERMQEKQSFWKTLNNLDCWRTDYKNFYVP